MCSLQYSLHGHPIELKSIIGRCLERVGFDEQRKHFNGRNLGDDGIFPSPFAAASVVVEASSRVSLVVVMVVGGGGGSYVGIFRRLRRRTSFTFLWTRFRQV